MACILSKTPILWRAASYKNIIFGPITKITLTRGCKHLTNKTNIYAEQKFKFKDNIGSDYKLIYREQTLVNLVTGVAYNGGWLGIFGSIFLTGYLIYINPPIQMERTNLHHGYVLEPLSNMGRVLALFAGVFASLSLILASRIIPFRIYHSRAQKLYKAVFVRILGKKLIITFAEGTAVPKFKRKFMSEILFDINGRTVLLDPECFPVPAVRERMICRTN